MARRIAIPAVALVVLIAGCGGETKTVTETTGGAAEQVPGTDPKVQAATDKIVESAQRLYASQGVTGATCRKTGFKPVIDVYTCVLHTSDGDTSPSDWDVVINPNTDEAEGAIPSKNGD